MPWEALARPCSMCWERCEKFAIGQQLGAMRRCF
jgi:hypothetical protein